MSDIDWSNVVEIGKRITALEAREAALVAILKRLEWREWPDSDVGCDICKQLKPRMIYGNSNVLHEEGGHSPTCELAALLKEAE